MNLTIVISFVGSLAISFISSLLVMYWYRRQHWVDDPKTNTHKKVIHVRSVPRGGGIPIFLSLLIVGSFVIGWDKHFIGILCGGAVLTIIGVLDDIHDLSPYLRLFTGLVAAVCVVAAGIGIAYVTKPFGSPGEVILLNQPQIAFDLLGKTRTIWILSDIFALIWIVWTMNMVNWSKGVDGQMPGFVSIAAVFIGILSLRFVGDITQWSVITLAAITAGAYLGFLFWNAYPQKIMPGYGGGSLAGYLLAVLAILSGAKLATLILVLGIPTLDAAYTIIRRLLKGKSPVWGDRGHLHHRLLDVGWSKKRVAYFYWVSTAVLGLIALQLNSQQKLFSFVALSLLMAGGLVWLKLNRYNYDTYRHHN